MRYSNQCTALEMDRIVKVYSYTDLPHRIETIKGWEKRINDPDISILCAMGHTIISITAWDEKSADEIFRRKVHKYVKNDEQYYDGEVVLSNG